MEQYMHSPQSATAMEGVQRETLKISVLKFLAKQIDDTETENWSVTEGGHEIRFVQGIELMQSEREV